jgi:hypothetical protein
MHPETTQVAAKLQLNCLVSGRDPSSGFTVEIDRHKLINQLKVEILRHPLAHIGGDKDFQLYRVGISHDDAKLHHSSHALNGAPHLSDPFKSLGDVFGDVVKGEIHVIVLQSSNGECSLVEAV